MNTLKILWVENEEKFGPSIHFKLEDQLLELNVKLEICDQLTDGKNVWETVRDLKPDIIMMDHNLEVVNINGATLTTEIRFHSNETPIIYYSSEMGPDLMYMVKNEYKVYTCHRGAVPDELFRVIKKEFT